MHIDCNRQTCISRGFLEEMDDHWIIPRYLQPENNHYYFAAFYLGDIILAVYQGD